MGLKRVAEVELQVLKFFVALAFPHLGDTFFGREGELCFHHPVVIGRFDFEDGFEGFALVFAKVEYLPMLFVVANVAYEVCPLAVGSETAELLYIVCYRLADGAVGGGVVDSIISVELGFEHFVCGDGVGIGTMGVFKVLATIELVGGLKGTLLHLMEDVLDIDESPAFEVERLSGAEEFLHQQRYVELVGIVSCKVGIADKSGYLGREVTECRFIGHIAIADAVDGGGEFGYMKRFSAVVDGTDTVHEKLRALVWINLVEADFHNVVSPDIYSSCFEVEEDNGFLQVEKHVQCVL